MGGEVSAAEYIYSTFEEMQEMLQCAKNNKIIWNCEMHRGNLDLTNIRENITRTFLKKVLKNPHPPAPKGKAVTAVVFWTQMP